MLAVALLLSVSSSAPGHAIVLESSPTHDTVLARSPEQVVLRFNSRIEPGLARVTITGGEGQAVPLTIASEAPGSQPAPDRLTIPLPPLPPGTYVIRFKVLAADGHVTESALRFTVKASP